MAEIFTREPIDGSDQGIWGDYELAQNRISLGILSTRLYNNAGVLTMTAGCIGYDQGALKGIYTNTATKTISIAAVSNGNWFKVELSTVGSVPTIAASDIAGETNIESIPASFLAAFDGVKGGYYITATKRIIGIGWKDSLGALGGILNMYPNINRFSGIITDSSNTFDYDYINSEQISNITLTLTANKTLTGIKGKYILHCNAGANGILITLPSAVTYPCMEIEADKIDSYSTNKSAVTFKSAQAFDDFAIQSSYYYLFLFDIRQNIKFKSNVTQYIITGGWLDYSTGGINTAVWTNRHLGDAVVGYDTVAAAFSVGEKVTAASGNTGVIVWLDATTMILKRVTGTGIFVNNEALTGSWGGSALENVSTKDVDSYLYHNTGLNPTRFDTNLYITENTTYSASSSIKAGDFFYFVDATTARWGFSIRGVSSSNFYIQTGIEGIAVCNTDGAAKGIDTEDYSYNFVARLYF